jgi:peptidoglycan hydrolase-like protein with peptidoglycan-binding domain
MGRVRRLVALLALLAAMLVSVAPAAEAAIPTIKYGSRGYSVQIWQNDLNFWLAHGGSDYIYHTYDLGTRVTSIATDGIFGNGTDYVTRAFQYRYRGHPHYLVADGIVGPKTRGVMCSFLNHYAGSNQQAVSLWLKTC